MAKSKKKNLSAVIPVCDIALKLIDPPQHNPREDFSEESLRSLAESIDTVGLLEAVIVRNKGKRYELVA